MYRCENCDHRFEAVQTFEDLPLEICPQCQGRVRRVIGNVGVTFKGSGFYRTDSRNAAKKTPSSGSKSGGKSTSTPKDGGDTKGPSTSADATKAVDKKD